MPRKVLFPSLPALLQAGTFLSYYSTEAIRVSSVSVHPTLHYHSGPWSTKGSAGPGFEV